MQRADGEVVLREESLPIGHRLEVHVDGAPLAGLRGREHDHIAQPREAADQRTSAP